jgi:hypothetical protein
MSNPRYHHYTRSRRRHPSSPSSYLHSRIMSLGKTHFLSELIHKLLTLYCTKPVAMGGSAIRNEPATTALLEQYPVAYQIFEQAGWLHYFRRLQWYNEQQVLQFALNLQEDHSVVNRVRISVTEEDIAAVSGLPTDGARIFSRKHIIRGAQQNFFLPEERIIFKGRGVQLSSLPPPWPGVAKFIKHYLTCEGRYQVVYQHELLLLSHLRHNRHVNIPYYLLGCLKNMVPYCRKAKDPTLSLTHHRLVQLLINRGFEQQNRPVNNPPLNPQPAAEIPHEQQQQNPPDAPEVPHALPTEPTSPVSPPTITESSPTIAESSTPALHILSDDSEPEKSAYPTTRGRPLRKRQQASPFPPFLRKKRIRTSTRPPLMTPTLATPPIRLTTRKPLTSPTPGSLPISTMGAATQEPDAPQTVTPSVSHKVAETQEPVTHPVAETQEPALAETQETATAETQEPAADIEMELQDSDAQTSFVFNKEAETQSAIYPVAETQEPVTDIEIELQELETTDAAAAETQEPATDLEIEEVETQDAVTPPSSSNMAEKPATHSMAETQEPPTDMEIDMQESEVEGAETLLSLHLEAETQASAAIPVAAPQEPAKEMMTATQEPVISKSKSTMSDVLQENEFLKSQLEAYQQELARAREAYEKELSRYALERTTILAERTTENICKEYMCCQCGDIYYRAGYKIVQVPVPGTAPTPSPFEIKTEPAETQEPAGPSRIKKETFTANKAVQTLPMEEVTPPSQANFPTSREQATQTLPSPTTSDAVTQTSHLWDEHAEIQKWKKAYAETQAHHLQVHRQTWRNHTFSNWEALDLTRQEVREAKKKNRDLKARMVKIFDLMHTVMATRKPSCNYSLFLMERLTWFQIKSLIEGNSHEVIQPTDFVKTFLAASTRDQHLLCEAYFHNEAIPDNRLLNINPLVGDVQLRAFTSFLYNQVLWQSDFSAAKHNEDNKPLWIRPEPERAARFISEYYEVLKKPGVTEHVLQLQSVVIQECQQSINAIEIPALQANNLIWQQSTKQRQQHNPFGPANLEAAISRIPSYIQCVRHCAENWIGYKFYFPLLWLPIETYQVSYKLSKKAETAAWHRLQEEQGFKTPTDSTARSYCLSTLHGQSQYQDSDSE